MGEEESSVRGSFNVELASAYVFRGVTVNDRPVGQPSLQLPLFSGFSLSVWGNFDLDRKEGSEQQFSEVDISGAYDVTWDGVDLAVSYTEYLYPGAETPADREIMLSLSYALPVQPSFRFAYGVDGGIQNDFYLEGGLEYQRAIREDLSFGLGALVAYDVPDGGGSGFRHYECRGSAEYSFISACLSYIGRWNSDLLTDEAYRKKWLFSLAFTFPF